MAEYQWVNHPEANIRFEVPVAWQREEKSKENLVLKSPRGDIEIDLAFVSFGSEEAKADERQLLAHLGERMSNPRIIKPAAPKSQHGLHGMGLAGVGLRDGVDIEWFTFAIGDGRGHGLVALAMAPEGRMADHVEEMLRIIGSIQPSGPSA